MSRENQIEEMAKLIGEVDQRCYEIEDCDDCPFHNMELGLCKEKFLATDLYNAGYRKSTDVAEEIFAEIEAVIERYINISWYTMEDVKKEFAELKKKYTEGGE